LFFQLLKLYPDVYRNNFDKRRVHCPTLKTVVMKFLQNFFAVLIIGLFSFSSCNKRPNEIKTCDNYLTTVIYILTPIDGGDIIELKFNDPDGDGGVEPTIATGNLVKNTVYNGTISILFEYESFVDDITEEIAEEGRYHQFFYIPSETELLIEYTDFDLDGYPIGIATKITTGDIGRGSLTITLQHEPNKTADGVSSGDIESSEGETDIEVIFPITIQ